MIMAIDIKGQDKFGCAYYVASEQRMLCMEEIAKPDEGVIETCEREAEGGTLRTDTIQ